MKRSVATGIALSLILFFSSLPATAGKLSRAWKAYTDGDFQGCRELCEKVLVKDTLNPFANYLVGLTIDQLGKSVNDFYTGLDYAERSRRGYDLSAVSDRDEMSQEYGFIEDNVYNLKEKLGNRILDILDNEPDIAAYNKFIDRVGIPFLAKKAVQERNHFAYLLAEQQGTIEAYTNFINTYPEAADVALAKQRINHLRYMAAKGNTDSLLHFIRTCPEAEDIPLAEKEIVDLIIDKATKTGQLHHLEYLIKQAPELAGVPYVKSLIYKTHFDLIAKSWDLDDWIPFTDRYEKAWSDEIVMGKLVTILNADTLNSQEIAAVNNWLERHPSEGSGLKHILYRKRMQGRTLYPVFHPATERWGFCDQNGQLMCEPIFKIAYGFNSGLALVKTEDDFYHYITTDFQRHASTYKNALPFGNGMALAWGRISENGFADEDVVLIDKEGNETILGRSGEQSCLSDRMLQPIRLDSAGRNASGKNVYIACAGSETWLVQSDFSHQPLSIPTPDDFEGEILPYASGGVLPYKLYGRFGLIDYRGRILCPGIYDGIAPSGIHGFFAANLGGASYDYDNNCVIDGGNWGLIRNNGVETVKIQYGYIGFFDNGPGPYQKNGYWGYLDENGRSVTPPIFSEAEVFHNQVARVQADGRYFHISRNGMEITTEYYVPERKLTVKTEDQELMIFNTSLLRNRLSDNPTDTDFEAEKSDFAAVDRDRVYSYVDEEAAFQGGESALNDYFQRNMRYPIEARQNGVVGRVHVTFVVSADGSVRDAKVVRGIGSGCDQEAIRLVQQMPKWKPAKVKGKEVNVQYTMPVPFKAK